MSKNKSAAPIAVGSGLGSNDSAVNSLHHRAAHKSQLKWERTLRAILGGPKNSFELEKAPVFDHCPNSTVSELKKRHGLVIVTNMIRVPGYANEGAMIAEYHLADESKAKAAALLGAA